MDTTDLALFVQPFSDPSLVPHDPSVVTGISGQVNAAQRAGFGQEIDVAGQVSRRIDHVDAPIVEQVENSWQTAVRFPFLVKVCTTGSLRGLFFGFLVDLFVWAGELDCSFSG